MTVVIAGYARTPFTKFTGQLATEPAADARRPRHHARRSTRAGVKPDEVQRVFAGQVLLGRRRPEPGASGGGRRGHPADRARDDDQHRLPLRHGGRRRRRAT